MPIHIHIVVRVMKPALLPTPPGPPGWLSFVAAQCLESSLHSKKRGSSYLARQPWYRSVEPAICDRHLLRRHRRHPYRVDHSALVESVPVPDPAIAMPVVSFPHDLVIVVVREDDRPTPLPSWW